MFIRYRATKTRNLNHLLVDKLFDVPFFIRRGMNPPHRIKSISMASFSPQEMEFLESHGNEVNYYAILILLY